MTTAGGLLSATAFWIASLPLKTSAAMEARQTRRFNQPKIYELRPGAIAPYELDILQRLRRALTFQRVMRQGEGYQREQVCCSNQKEVT
jgi:hypothetical protein